MDIRFKTKPRRDVPLKLRSQCALNAYDRLKIKEYTRSIGKLILLYKRLKLVPNLSNESRNRKKKRLLRFLKLGVLSEYTNYLKVITIVELPPIPKMHFVPHTFESIFTHLRNLSIDYSEKFRFLNVDQLRRIKVGFLFPEGKVKVGTYSTTSEEIILIAMARLSWPSRWSDLMLLFAGRKRWFLGRCFYWYLNYMIDNWAYLLVNNIDYWIPHLEASCEAIRKKLANLAYVNWRLNFEPWNQPNGFTVFAFID